MANPSDFFAQMMPYAQRVSQQTGLDPRLVLAQAALETGYGRSAPGNNFFGIKSHNRSGGNTLQTQEFEGGRMVTKPQSFRGYETPAQSFEDYGRFLQENPRYKPVLAAGTLEEQIAAMARSGYATDPNYGQKLASIASRVDPNAPVNIASDAMRAIGRPSGGGLLAPNETVSTQGRTSGQGEPMAEERGLLGGLLNPDRRDRLIMALEGMTLNPNQALIQASGEAIKGRAESQQSKQAANRTAAWLRSQGREDLAAAVESGAVSGRDAASAALQPPADDRTAGLKEYEAAVQQGFQGSFLDYKTALAQAGRPETNVNVGTGEGAFQKKTGEVLATEAAEIVTQGAQAQRSLGQIQVLEGALQRAPSGALGSITNMAANLGIKTEGASDIELANSIISQLVPQQRPPGSGVMSDADLELFKQSLPRLINTREGNQMIVNTMKSIAEYDMQRAAIARQLQLGQITQEDAFAAYQSLGNPIPPELRTGGAPAAGGQAGGGSKRMRFNPETGQLEAVQ